MKNDIDYHALGSRIKTVRKSKKMTQEQLAELCSLSTAHIGHIERGTRIPSLDTLFRISQALEVSIDYFVFDSLSNDTDCLASIKEILKNKNTEKTKIIISTLKALSDNIDTINI